MTIHRTHEIPVITNVSRRRLLKGLAASGGLVLAAQYPALAAPPFYPTGAEAMPNKTVSDPKVFVQIEPERDRRRSSRRVPKWARARRARPCR